ncbi:hypothetical protein F511_34469 [Dorcoceras hygrometricum]|uniref:Uncharacterized protein n=1 Tax=Dorcoceras hygrometricum TaxID=472368 RepID=A0A2Z7CLC1_9LAMI|nr:hypothetical protein F511_34469 [Dorcoceras hygrometricum]
MLVSIQHYSANSPPRPSPFSRRRLCAVARRRHRTSLLSSRQGDSAHEIFVGVIVHSNEGIGKSDVDRIRSNKRWAISFGRIVGARRLVARQTTARYAATPPQCDRRTSAAQLPYSSRQPPRAALGSPMHALAHHVRHSLVDAVESMCGALAVPLLPGGCLDRAV